MSNASSVVMGGNDNDNNITALPENLEDNQMK